MTIINLNKEIFNNEYNIVKMSNKSIVIEHFIQKEPIYIHRRVLNTILSSEELIPCSICTKEFHGRPMKWMATMFTF